MQMHVALEAFRGDHRKVRIVFEHPPMEEYVARSERSSAALHSLTVRRQAQTSRARVVELDQTRGYSSNELGSVMTADSLPKVRGRSADEPVKDMNNRAGRGDGPHSPLQIRMESITGGCQTCSGRSSTAFVEIDQAAYSRCFDLWRLRAGPPMVQPRRFRTSI